MEALDCIYSPENCEDSGTELSTVKVWYDSQSIVERLRARRPGIRS